MSWIHDACSQGLKSYDKNMRFLLQKVLKQSDVGNLGRIVLPKVIKLINYILTFYDSR